MSSANNSFETGESTTIQAAQPQSESRATPPSLPPPPTPANEFSLGVTSKPPAIPSDESGHGQSAANAATASSDASMEGSMPATQAKIAAPAPPLPPPPVATAISKPSSLTITPSPAAAATAAGVTRDPPAPISVVSSDSAPPTSKLTITPTTIVASTNISTVSALPAPDVSTRLSVSRNEELTSATIEMSSATAAKNVLSSPQVAVASSASSDAGLAHSLAREPLKPEMLFLGWRFFLSGNVKDKVTSELEGRGGIQKSYLSSTVTHFIIGEEPDPADISEAAEIHEIPVLRQDYIEDAVKLGRIPPPLAYSAQPGQLFSGLTLCFSGLSSHDRCAIWAMAAVNGGTVGVEVRSGATTHLVTARTSSRKIEVCHNIGIKVVTPDWITDSVKAKLLMPEEKYHPRLLLLPGQTARKVRRKKKPKAECAPPPMAASMTSVISTSSTGITTSIAPSTSRGNIAPILPTPTTATRDASMTPLTTAMGSKTSTPPAVLSASIQSIKLPQTPVSIPQPQQQQQTQQGPPQDQQPPSIHQKIQHQQQQHQQQQQQPQQQPQIQRLPLPQQPQQQPNIGSQQLEQQPGHLQSQQTQHQPQEQQQPPQPHQIVPQPVQPSMPQIPQQQQQWQQHQQQQQQQQQQAQWNQQQFRQPMMQQQQQPGVWPQQQAVPQPSQMGMRPRHPSPHMMRQQQIIQQHIGSLTPEQRTQFQQMPARDKQQYLARRNLLLPQVPQQQQHMIQRQTITLTDQQRSMLQTMTEEQRGPFLARIQREQQIRQQMQQNQQGHIVPPQQQQQQQQQQQHWQQQQQQFPPQSQGQMVRVPHSSPSGMQPRPAWSGETHPALAQVPRTPQQLQHLQRLQMQREQQQQMEQQRPPMQPGVQQQQMMGQPQVVHMNSPHNQFPQQQQQQQQQQQHHNGSSQTKVALANMLNNRLQQPGMPPGSVPMPLPQGPSGAGTSIQQVTPPLGPTGAQIGPRLPTGAAAAAAAAVVPMSPGAGRGGMPPTTVTVASSAGAPAPQIAPDGTASNRLQMMNQQLQQHQVSPGPPVPPGQVMRHPQSPIFVHQGHHRPPPPPSFMVQQGPPPATGGPPGGMVNNHMGGSHAVRYIGPQGARLTMPPGGPPGQQPPPQARIAFHGHDPNTRLPPDLCLLGCIFHIIDYQDDSEKSGYVPSWTKTIRQYGGEVEPSYHPRITHLLCINQDTALAQQALREGKRIVSSYWLNDVVARKKVMPPWKAVHFPLPKDFEPPCENMILALTGFEGRDRDFIKDMIKWTGAKYTSYFSRHNHVIICQNAVGEKYHKAKEWKTPAVSVQWLNDVLFGNMNADQIMHNPKYHNFRLDDPFRMDYSLVPHLISAWKIPIRVTPETYQKFKANPPARIKRKAEKQRLEKEEAKRMRESAEMQAANNNNLQTMSQQPQFPQTELSGQQQSYQQMPPIDSVTLQQQQQQPSASNQQNGTRENDAKDISNSKDGEANIERKEQSSIENSMQVDGRSNTTVTGPKIIFTGFVQSTLKDLTAMVTELGGEVVPPELISTATHLVMPVLERTISMMCALNYVHHILRADWIRESKKEKKWLDESCFQFEDDVAEQKFFHTSVMNRLLKPDRSKLFEGKSFFLTPSIKPHWKQLRRVIEAAGGRVEMPPRRNLSQIKRANEEGKDPTYIIVTCHHDLHLVEDVLKARMGVFSSESVMSSVLTGTVCFEFAENIETL